MNRCKYIREKSFTAKVSEHIPSGFSMPVKSSCKDMKNKHDLWIHV